MKAQKFEFIQQAMIDEMIGADGLNFVAQGDPNVAMLFAHLAAFTREAKRTLSSNSPLVVYQNNRDGTLKLDAHGLPLGRLTNAAQRLLTSMQCLPLLDQYRSSLAAYELHPSAVLLSKLKDTHYFHLINPSTINQQISPQQFLGQVLNEEVNVLRKKSKYKNHIKAVQEWDAPIQRNYRGLLNYLNGLFEYNPVINVAKLDVGYLPHSPRGPSELTMDVERYLSAMAFDDQYAQLIGYAFRLSHTSTRAYYAHIVLMFAPTALGAGCGRVDQLGRIWLNMVNNNTGNYWHCPARTLKGSGSGGFDIGGVNYLKEQFVRDTALYLAHMDDFIRLRRVSSAGSERWIGSGTLPKK